MIRLQPKYRALTLTSLIHGVNHSFWVIVPVVLTFVIQEFQVSVAEAGLLFTAFLVSYALSQLPVGSIADRVDRRWLIGIGLGVTSVGMILSSFANTFAELLAYQIIAGIGGGTFHPSSISIISDHFNDKERGRALGLHGFAASLALFLSPLAVSYFLGLGWRFPFLAMGLTGLFFTVIFVSLVGKQKKLNPGKMGYVDVVSHNRPLLFLASAGALLAMSERGLVTFLPLFLIVSYGLSVMLASQLFAFLFLLAIPGQIIGGLLTDRVNRRLLAATLGSIVTVMLLVLSVKPPQVLILPILALLGIAVYGLIPLLDTLIVGTIPAAGRGKGLGAYFTISITVGAFSPVISGQIIDHYGFQIIYVILATIAFISLPIIVKHAKFTDFQSSK